MAFDVPDHPVIRNCERTGHPWPVAEPAACPVCGAECGVIYVDELGYPAGCDACVEKRMADGQGADACPSCQTERPEWIYVKDGEPIGCEHCVTEEDPQE